VISNAGGLNPLGCARACGEALQDAGCAGRTIAVVSGDDFGIFTQSPERARAAWLFARWLAEPAQTARWASATLSIPLRVSALPILANTAPSPLLQQLRGGLGDTPPTVRSLPASKFAAPLDAAVTNMWITVANGADPTAAVNSAAAQVNRLMSP
jgi:ABC-type glycerol-3-phosphate transport system substrate-binding protein